MADSRCHGGHDSNQGPVLLYVPHGERGVSYWTIYHLCLMINVLLELLRLTSRTRVGFFIISDYPYSFFIYLFLVIANLLSWKDIYIYLSPRLGVNMIRKGGTGNGVENKKKVM